MDRMDWRAWAFDHHRRNGGQGHLPTKIARRAWHLNNFFKCPGYARGFAQGGRMLAAGIDSHIIM